jgi:hypothetical protein
MKRRDFITLAGGMAVWSLAVRAQQGERMPRVAVLHVLAESDFEARSWVNALKQGLSEFGWNDGLNVRIEVRAGEVTRCRNLQGTGRSSPRRNRCYGDSFGPCDPAGDPGFCRPDFPL